MKKDKAKQQMIFPIDIYNILQIKVSSSTKYEVIISWSIILSILLFLIIIYFFNLFLPQTPKIIPILLGIFIILNVLLYLYRKLIFNENEKMREYNRTDSDAFGKYVYLRSNSESKLVKAKIPYLEFITGNPFIILCLKFGDTNEVKANNTENILANIFRLACIENISFRTFTGTENFKESKEYLDYIKRLNQIQNKKIAKDMMDMGLYLFNKSNETCNTNILYLMFEANGTLGIDKLDTLALQIMKLFTKYQNAIRQSYFLNQKQLIEFYKEFYKVKMIDLTTLKTVEMVQNNEIIYTNIVKLIGVTDEEGNYWGKKVNDDTSFIQQKNLIIK